MSHATCSPALTDGMRGAVDADDVEIHYLKRGSGPLVICSHGFPDNAFTFLPLVDALAEAGFTAVAPYLRGYAPSGAAPVDQYHTCYMARDLIALVDGLASSTRFWSDTTGARRRPSRPRSCFRSA